MKDTTKEIKDRIRSDSGYCSCDSIEIFFDDKPIQSEQDLLDILDRAREEGKREMLRELVTVIKHGTVEEFEEELSKLTTK